MLITVEDVIEYVDGSESFEFDYWNRGRFRYINSNFIITFVANYSDELDPIEMLRELIFMEDVKVFCKKTDRWVYKDFWE